SANRRRHEPGQRGKPGQTPRMSVYAGRYAGLYDLFYADKPYAAEAAFVHECIREFSLFPVRRGLSLLAGPADTLSNWKSAATTLLQLIARQTCCSRPSARG